MMGMIIIEASGSFKFSQKQFCAIDHGHADAVAQAIEYLASELLPKSIFMDHKLHSENERPNKGFGRKKE